MDRFYFNNMVWKKKKAPLWMVFMTLLTAFLSFAACIQSFSASNMKYDIALWVAVVLFMVMFSLLYTNEEPADVKGVFHFTRDSLDLEYEFEGTGEHRQYSLPLSGVSAVYDRRREYIDIKSAGRSHVKEEKIRILRTAPLDEIAKYLSAYGIKVRVKGEKESGNG